MAGSQRRTTRRSTKSGNAIMYAGLVTGGKQYRVMKGETLRVELLGEHEAGDEITFDHVLMLGDGDGIKVGDALKGASVTATVVGQGRAGKVRIGQCQNGRGSWWERGGAEGYNEGGG